MVVHQQSEAYHKHMVKVEIKQVHQVLLAQNTQCYIMCL